eukprot:CAMPEP_0198120414 /NCGR_PEP_ID=MMETSP1442-20131203/28960_1 /TAXON_ID= /ORGANISM="Craspedostauros australis, Strain CCMP3328" /LENGTH=388 /DNA_ID=CAMNT_0043779061 /DNA_START=63 /DNA_END=1229 /DNA_ORIENTATION=+
MKHHNLQKVRVVASVALLVLASCCISGTAAFSMPRSHPPTSVALASALRAGSRGSNAKAQRNSDSALKTSTDSTDVVSPTTDSEKPADATTDASTEVASEAAPAGIAASIRETFKIQPFVAVFVGTVLTYLVNNELSWGPIRAAASVGSIAAMALPPNLALATLCGSYAGMARTTVVPTVASSAILGAVCATILAIFDRLKLFIGIGGRLGFTAQCACTLQFLVATTIFASSATGAALFQPFGSFGKLASDLPFVALWTIVGAFGVTYWRNFFAAEGEVSVVRTRLSSMSAAVSIVGLLGTFVSPAVAGPIYCGTFVAMASPLRLPTYGSLLLASIMAGVSQQLLSAALLGGWGGKLGTGAFLGVVSSMGLASMFRGKSNDEPVLVSP